MVPSLNDNSIRSRGHFVRGLPFKAHKIAGFSPETLERHYEEIYGGAVRRLNAVENAMAADPADADLHEQWLTTANAVILHEVYFDSIGEEGGEALSSRALREAIEASFGSIDIWQTAFSSQAVEMKSGWLTLAWSQRFERLVAVAAVDVLPLAGAVPILAIDMNDHAFAGDFGQDRRAYVAAFVGNIHWPRVAEPFRKALGAAVEAEQDRDQVSIAELKERLDAGDDILVLDVRHDDDRERYKSRVMETGWRDSFDVAGWAGELPKDKPVVVYCMYGFWVSQKAAQELREQGVDARSLTGGITAWRAMGFPSTDTPPA